MGIDPRTPVLVGGGQFIQKPTDPTNALEPIAMMAEAVEAAVDDAGSHTLLSAADVVAVVRGAWSYSDPARLLADRFGARDSKTMITTDGGNTPQALVNELCGRIASGQAEVAIVAGGEAIYTRRRLREAGAKLVTTLQEGVTPDEVFGSQLQMSSPIELQRGFAMPVHFYPTFESAIRYARGEKLDEHRDRISRLWERFNRVAVDNPYAWMRTPMTAEEIRQPSAENRMVGFPYTKAMNSNWFLDQAAAVILCSAGKAASLGVARDRWVFPLAGTDAHDTMLVSNRDNLHSSPAIREAARRLFKLAGVGVEDVDHVDLYSCFPSAVEIAAAEIGLSEDRPLTVTGGLPFAGGPLNNYVTHSIATMAGVLRSDPGSKGLVTANGGYVTKHSLALYSTEPPDDGFRRDDVQEEVDRSPTREAVGEWEGPVTIEAYTVMHSHGGPEQALVACLLKDGRRAWGNTNEEDVMEAMISEEFCGRAASLSTEGVVSAA